MEAARGSGGGAEMESVHLQLMGWTLYLNPRTLLTAGKPSFFREQTLPKTAHLRLLALAVICFTFSWRHEQHGFGLLSRSSQADI